MDVLVFPLEWREFKSKEWSVTTCHLTYSLSTIFISLLSRGKTPKGDCMNRLIQEAVDITAQQYQLCGWLESIPSHFPSPKRSAGILYSPEQPAWRILIGAIVKRSKTADFQSAMRRFESVWHHLSPS